MPLKIQDTPPYLLANFFSRVNDAYLKVINPFKGFKLILSYPMV